jgi:hypothetical protein
MLVAKINPVVKLAKQDDLFNVSSVEADTIIVAARPYVLGSKDVNFEVLFGNVGNSEETGEKQFISLNSQQVVLTAEEIGEWGTDDTIVLNAIATKLGTSIESSEVF